MKKQCIELSAKILLGISKIYNGNVYIGGYYKPRKTKEEKRKENLHFYR